MIRGRSSAPSDEGYTLIEVLITIIVISLAVTGLVGGLIAAASGSTSSQRTTDARQALGAVAEEIQAASYSGSATSAANCAAPSYAAAISAAKAPSNPGGINPGPAVTVKAISFWDGAQFVAYGTGASAADCAFDHSPGTVDARMQKITLTSAGEDLTLIKRSP